MTTVTTIAARTVPISTPQLGPEVEELVLQVLRSGHLAQGPMVARLEDLCAAMAGTRHAVAVNSGTAALEAAFVATGIGPGDEVITTPFTFAATLNAVLATGATVRFADIGDDHCIDPASAEALIGARTRVLLPVHLYGLPADLPAFASLAARHGLALVEDAAQAHGAEAGGIAAGGAGIGCFSFYATKNVAAGEGGVVTTNDGAVADTIRVVRNQGMRRRYEYEMVGRNLRMTDLAAAVAIPQMARLAEITAVRTANASALSAALRGRVAGLELPEPVPGRKHVWHQYTVLLPPHTDRDAVVARMTAAGVSTGVYYPGLVWEAAAYRDHPGVVRDETPRARSVSRRCLSLPVHPALGRGDIERVAASLVAACGG